MKEEVGQAVVLVRVVDVELTKKAPGSSTSVATLVMEVRAVLRINDSVTVTKVVISGPKDVVAAVIFKLAVVGKKAPGELAATAPFGKRGYLGLLRSRGWTW